MKFSWKALIIAPLAAPLAYSALLTISAPGRSPIFSFFFFFALGAVLSYTTTVCLFLPCLFLISRRAPLTAGVTALAGTTLGAAVWLPVVWQSYLASGENSGPPQGPFGAYLWQNLTGEAWLFPLAGLVTALVYWLLANRRA